MPDNTVVSQVTCKRVQFTNKYVADAVEEGKA